MVMAMITTTMAMTAMGMAAVAGYGVVRWPGLRESLGAGQGEGGVPVPGVRDGTVCTCAACTVTILYSRSVQCTLH